MIYVDNAATTPVSKAALNAMLPYFSDDFGNPSSGNAAGRRAKSAIREARATIAEYIGAKPEEVYFTSCGTEADNQAIFSAAVAGKAKGKTQIISSKIEHHAVLNTLADLEKRGFEIVLLDVSELGHVSPSDVAAAINEKTALVTIMFANNEIGTIQSVEEIGEICRSRKVPFHTDAVQAAGQVRIDVAKQNIDMLSISAHKFHGPKGAGILYCRDGIRLSGIITGGGQEHGARAGTENVPAIVGMAVALQESQERIDRDGPRIAGLRDDLICGLMKIPGIVLNGPRFSRLPGNVNICVENVPGEISLPLLEAKGILASGGAACSAGSKSHVLQAIGRSEVETGTELRFSLSRENKRAEIEIIVQAMEEIAKRVRKMPWLKSETEA